MSHDRELEFHDTIKLDVRRCLNCRTWFGVEKGYQRWTCGVCVLRDNTHLSEVLTKLNRSNSALRGALKRRAR